MNEKTNVVELQKLVEQLQEENKELKSKRKFGLVFEDKKEELPLEIENGVMVFDGFIYREIGRDNEILEGCLTKNGLSAKIKNISGSEILYDIQNNIVMGYESRYYLQAEETSKKYFPNLEMKAQSLHSESAPVNYLIEGDNYHALQLLKATHKGLVDVIYIDPPYNTGNKDFIYNDKYVGEEDGYKHSKWLSFMEKRLKLAKNLLSEDGFIYISIDKNEHHRLKLICDQVFGENNFMSDISWYKGYTKSLGNFFGNTLENILVYSKNKNHLNEIGFKLKEKKKYAEEVLEIVEKNNDKTIKEIETLVRKFYKLHNIKKGLLVYTKIDQNKKLYRTDSFTNRQKTNSPHSYEIINPFTGSPYDIPQNGWRIKEETFNRYFSENRILLTENAVQIKFFLEDTLFNNPSNLIENHSIGGKDLKDIGFKNNQFSFPKPVSLLKYLINLNGKKDSLILDFFAGSGTTGHAVAELNAEDGGTRQYILCTNNQNNIAKDVTFERLKRISNPTEYNLTVDALPHNVVYKKINAISEDNLYADKLVELLKLQEGCEIAIQHKDLKCFTNYEKSIVFNFVDTDKAQLEEFVELYPKTIILYEQDEDLDDQMKSLKKRFPEIIINFIPNKIITELKKGE